MAEQTEIKKVITVDLGNATTSIKDYKKHIDDLRGSLLQLDESSEEYAKIAAEIKTEQDKLNEVMKVGKGITEAADGSYDQLTKTMSELKKQWRATADEAERTDLGSQILEINNKLKDLDASTGNFQRNVGDYSNAFEEAFKKCLGGVQNLDGPIGTLSKDVAGLIPLIKNVNKTATAGLSGIRKGIASTGIGALIIAIGLLAAHWEEVEEAVNKAFHKTSEYVEKIKEAKLYQEMLTARVAATNEEISKTIRLMAATGATALQQAQAEYDLRKQQKDALETEYNLKKEEYEAELAHLNKVQEVQSRIRARGQRGTAGISAEDKAMMAEDIIGLRKYVEALEDEVNNAKETFSTAEKEFIKVSNNLEVTIATTDANIEATLRSQADALKFTYEKTIEDIETLRQRALETAETEEQVTNIMQEYDNKKLGITQKYLDDLAALNNKHNKDYNDSLLKQEDEIQKQAQSILDTLHKNTTDQITLLSERYQQEYVLLVKAGQDTTALVEYYQNEIQKLREEGIDTTIEKEINAYYAKQEREAEQAEFELQLVEQRATNRLEELDEAEEAAQKQYEIEQSLLTSKIEFLEAELEEYEGTAEQKLALEQELDGYRQEFANNERLRAKETSEYRAAKEQEAAKITKMAWQSAASSIGSILGSLSDLMEEGSEEAKAFAAMETVVNTLSGAIAAYKAMAGIPYVGPALGAAAAAAVALAGAANLKKIYAAKPSTSGGGGESTPELPKAVTSDVAVSPLLDENADINRLTNLNEEPESSKGEQNLRVYVVDQDIRDANHRAEVVDDNSTF